MQPSERDPFVLAKLLDRDAQEFRRAVDDHDAELAVEHA